ncbi:P-loop NTPase fold protein [uncultured Bacteroides sp.]|uniref:KAP family P-loop NTPase fold protein n=1 Tax=uncultured Bacteroides sp. TaxID=162156 RepID=UPI0025F436DB|nr:P-loop NTPase fold protein [uncultured Bacteroides sp.]
MKSSIIDVPRRHDQEDLFGIKIYQDALIQYIKLTDTPITIALQGEWGSGKTSLMNLLRWNLCDIDNAQFFPIWINTWQFSLMKTPAQAIISILEGIINQIGALNPTHKWEESKRKIGGLFKKIASVGTKVAASTVGVDGEALEDLFGSDNGQSDILQLKEEISKLVDESLKNNPNKAGFTFFIDDLDRIDPPVAVEILELLKNIFDLEHCIFILAIDYDVVIKGLKPKFGELTDKNEREFRSFFDKIIQLPFSMPVANYNIDTFLVDALSKINFFSEEEMKDHSIQEAVSELARLSVGTNPRSLKRLTNTLSLISIINSGIAKAGAEDIANKYKVINFGLVCMQIAYPYIYNQLAEEPDFKQWNETIAAKLKLRTLTPDEQKSLDAAEEFDEEWEKIVFRMCQKETHLSNRVFQVSQMLNKLAELIKDDNNIGKVIEDTIELSAVTNLKAFDTPKKAYVFNRDTNNYKFEGKEYSIKVELVRDVVRRYLKDHPGTTKAMLQAAFPIKKNMETIFMGKDTYTEKQAAGKLNFIKKNATDSDFIETADEPIIICSNWPTTSQGKPAEFTIFLEIVNKQLGYLVTQA